MKILRLASKQEKSGITYYSLVFDKILGQQGIEVIKPNYLSDTYSTWWLPLDFLFRRNYWGGLLSSIDAVHAEIGMHQAKEILTLNYLIGKRKNLKIFVTVHDPGVKSYRIFKLYQNTSGSLVSKLLNKITDKIEPLVDRLLFKGIVKKILKKASIIFVFNRWGIEQLKGKYPEIFGERGQKIKTINHPVYDFSKEKIKQIGGRKIVFAGFWSQDKGIEILLQAYDLLVKKKGVGTPHLILAGSTQIPNSSYIRRIKKIIKVLGLENFVSFPGFLKAKEMFKILSESILIIPYTNKMSGSASGIHIQGLQAGAVTIVANSPTLAGLVTDNRVSLIFKQGSAEDLSRKIEEVIENQDLAYYLAKNGQEFVYKYGDWEKIGKEIVNIYGLLIGRDQAV